MIAIGVLNIQEGIPILEDFLRNYPNAKKHDTGIQLLLRDVIESLVQLHAESAIEMLVTLLQNGFRDDIVGEDFVKAVHAIQLPKKTSKLFKPLLNSDDSQIRLTALEILIPITQAKELSRCLLNLITNMTDWRIQIAAIKFLTKELCSEIGIELVRFLGHLSVPQPDENSIEMIRRDLVQQLASVGDATLLPELMRLLDSADPEIQDEAHLLIYVINQKIGNRWIYLNKDAAEMPLIKRRPLTDSTIGGHTMMNYHCQLPSFLVEEFKKGNGVLFIGAGLSMGAGLPSWRQLVEPLADEIGCPKDNLLKIPQYYVQAHGSRVPLYQYLKRKIKVPNVMPTENHHLLTQLPVRVIFTTNYDELLEDTLREKRIPFHRIVLDKGIGS